MPSSTTLLLQQALTALEAGFISPAFGEALSSKELDVLIAKKNKLQAEAVRDLRRALAPSEPASPCAAENPVVAQFNAKYGEMAPVMRAVNRWSCQVESFHKGALTNQQLEEAEQQMLAAIKGWADGR